ncbi:hypothetical protein O6B97_01165 [Campylobacter ureolyticus]|uniref:hypothetical protein n=1 Tax=Campylobacter ureolyticus TaxID=827 RepID=UPI0022B54C76|nr:hypothetical protein [Campylobacter ureolyticus]MCZ6175093.1 hypothetical protein [Campylobacter ureolyticus]MCZ6185707.1 hypothetical protein [Campylobacter ureolyticus]
MIISTILFIGIIIIFVTNTHKTKNGKILLWIINIMMILEAIRNIMIFYDDYQTEKEIKKQLEFMNEAYKPIEKEINNMIEMFKMPNLDFNKNKIYKEKEIKQEKTIKKEIDKPKFVITKDKNQTTIQRLPKKENKNIFIEIN